MFTAGTVLAGLATYGFMLVAFFNTKRRWLHIPIMVAIMLFDLAMPFYLYLTRDWYRRLILHGEILSFLLWMHLGLVFTLYALYFLQIQTAHNLFWHNGKARIDHNIQGKAVLLVRGLVIVTGAMLVDPNTQSN